MKLEKITITSPRRYDDACGTAHALELIGERWSLLIVRELMLGPRRFGDLRANLPGLSANVLTQRLEMLDAGGVVRKAKLPPPASVQVYELTPWGLEAEPIISALGRWGARSTLHDPTRPLSAVSMVLSFRTMFEPQRAGDLKISANFAIGDERYWIAIDHGRLASGRGDVENADFTLFGDPGAIAGLVYGFATLDDLTDKGIVMLEGGRDGFERFARCFELPDKAQ